MSPVSAPRGLVDPSLTARRSRPGTVRLPLVGTRLRVRGIAVVLGLLVITAALAVWRLGQGDFALTPAQTFDALLGRGGFAATVVQQWRAPRILAGIAFGAALAASGAVFQSLTRNPLGSPDVIGFATGSYTGVLLVTTLGLGSTYITGGALIGGLTTAFVVYALAYRGGLDATRLVVVGIGVTAMLQALNLYLLLRSQAEVAMAASIWGAGSLSLVDWAHLVPALVAIVVLAPLLALLVPGLRQLELGDDSARARGLRVEPARLGLVVVAVALVAVPTAVAGPVAFVALVAPQLAARMAGGAGIPVVASAATGALLLTAADALTAAMGTDVPVGIVTIVVGGVYLLALLVAQARR